MIVGIMNESETEHDRKVRECWASAYKNKNKNNKFSIYEIGSADLNQGGGY
jgi:hypothetical protein